jgi:hypothetical protein
MAASKECIEDSAPVLSDNVVEKEYICEGCNSMRLELNDLKIELKSCKEIIRMLHEETQVNKATQCAERDKKQGDQIEVIQSNTWTQSGNWQFTSDHRRRPRKIRRQFQQTSLQTSNQFDPLLNLEEGGEVLRCSKINGRDKVARENRARKFERKIVIIGDSHARNCATELYHRLGKKCDVIGYFKPGAQMKDIVQSGKEEIKKLNRKDVVVVWGGSNDIGKQNTQEALRQLCEFVEKSKDVNVIVMTAPHRHDLMTSSCVNGEVGRFNRLLGESMRPYKKVKILDTDLNRDCFTRHGLHMNYSGKELLTLKLAGMIDSLAGKSGESGNKLQRKVDGTGGGVDSPQTREMESSTTPVRDEVLRNNEDEVVSVVNLVPTHEDRDDVNVVYMIPANDERDVVNVVHMVPTNDGDIVNVVNKVPSNDEGDVVNVVNTVPIDDGGGVVNKVPTNDEGDVENVVNMVPINDVGDVVNVVNLGPPKDEGNVDFAVNQEPKIEAGGVDKPRMSKRQRKPWAMKDQDFLWQI